MAFPGAAFPLAQSVLVFLVTLVPPLVVKADGRDLKLSLIFLPEWIGIGCEGDPFARPPARRVCRKGAFNGTGPPWILPPPRAARCCKRAFLCRRTCLFVLRVHHEGTACAVKSGVRSLPLRASGDAPRVSVVAHVSRFAGLS